MLSVSRAKAPQSKGLQGLWVEKKRFTVEHSAMKGPQYPGSSGSLASGWSPGERLDIFHRRNQANSKKPLAKEPEEDAGYEIPLFQT